MKKLGQKELIVIEIDLDISSFLLTVNFLDLRGEEKNEFI